MFSTIRLVKFASVLFATAALLGGMATPSNAQSRPASTTGTVSIDVFKAGFIVGAGGGRGTLVFRGRTYPLSIGGIGIGTIGIASVRLRGTASNLRTATDIVGTYGAAGAGATFVGGGQVATLQNDRGVVLQLRGPQVGFQANLGVGGMTISMR
jgi:hypothetical protein